MAAQPYTPALSETQRDHVASRSAGRSAAWEIALYVFLFIILVSALAPVIWMVVGSVKMESEVTALPVIWFPQNGLQFQNYVTVLQTTPLPIGYINSLIIGIAVTAVEVFTSVMAGYAFAKLDFRGRDFLFVGVLSTMMLPAFLLQMPLFVVMQRLGWLNTYQAMIVPFLATPFGIFMMRQFILNVPTDYIDQARVDGAGEIGLIWRVVFPLCTQAAVALAIFVFIANWDQLFWPLLVLRQKDMYTLPLALYSIQGEMGTFYHLILAGATLAVIPPLLVYVFFQDKIVQGITLTGLKG